MPEGQSGGIVVSGQVEFARELDRRVIAMAVDRRLRELADIGRRFGARE